MAIQISGSPVVHAIAARYTDTSGTTLNSSSAVQIPFATKDYDTNNAVSSGIFTVPSTGYYQINARFETNTAGVNAQIQIWKNGSVYTSFDDPAQVPAIPDVLSLNSGDTIAIYGIAGGTTSLITAAGFNVFSIIKVG